MSDLTIGLTLAGAAGCVVVGWFTAYLVAYLCYRNERMKS